MRERFIIWIALLVGAFILTREPVDTNQYANCITKAQSHTDVQNLEALCKELP